MSEMTVKKSTIILQTPHELTDVQNSALRQHILSQLPAEVGLVILRPGFTWAEIQSTP